MVMGYLGRTHTERTPLFPHLNNRRRRGLGISAVNKMFTPRTNLSRLRIAVHLFAGGQN